MADRRQKRAPREVDTSRPSTSRVYGFMLGGKDNYEADRRLALRVLEIMPDAPEAALANREFRTRVVRFLAAEAGVRQFLDIGVGLPAQDNVHEVARSAAPGSRVVYVDHDPIVLVHGRALLAVDDRTAIVEGDARDPDAIIDDPETRRLIDLGEPVGLLMLGVLHHLADHEDPAGMVARLMARLPAGSHLAVSHFHNPADHPEASGQAYAAEKLFHESLGTGRWRTRAEILACFDGLELLEPGLVPLPEWRPDSGDRAKPGLAHHTVLGGVARKT
ncbi:SAM-dependent methyltransferase [Nonomuraea sp. B19D2]|uniref:SAM-dependent methyltransferase n=1 Tax=Nonomuraea sp. B19D2 TaxID=3159561 RepID=UPI0032DA3725